MSDNFLRLREYLQNTQTKFSKNGFKEIIQNYDFYYLSKTSIITEEEEHNIRQNLKESKLIIIDSNEDLTHEMNETCFIISFEKTVIILEQSLTLSFYDLLSSNMSLSVCFLADVQDAFNKIELHEIKVDSTFNEEIQNFVNNFYFFRGAPNLNLYWSFIVRSISGYLIQKSYSQRNKNRIKQFIIDDIENTHQKIENMTEKDYIELREIGCGSVFRCVLIYYVKLCELFVLKIPYENVSEYQKLMTREALNYEKIKHPLLPKYYGTVKDKEWIIIEYINGKTLDKVNLGSLSYENRLVIIFELMMIINYFHNRMKMIYRDLKANNIIVDDNNTVVLIDFDRLIELDESIDQTVDLGGSYAAPEIKETCKLTYKSDIYSLGKVIEYIMNGQKLDSNIDDIIIKCMNKLPEDRPSISELIQYFNSKIKNEIKIENLKMTFNNYLQKFEIIDDMAKLVNLNQNDIRIYSYLGYFYMDGLFVSEDENKAIHYLSSAAKENDIDAQYNLGGLYMRENSKNFNIDKAIHYLTLAAEQKHPGANFILGEIYHSGQYCKQDKKKGIQYFTIASNLNHSFAQFDLGFFYLTGDYFEKDIKKAIHYFSLAEKKNNSKVHFNLGILYSTKEYMIYDIEKAIHCFSIAADQNHLDAQFNLGLLYYDKNIDKYDINKAVYYFTLAANQNHLEAQFNLGLLYFDKNINIHDINKAVYYFELAANQNHSNAQYNLGMIYSHEKNLYDINKAVYYFELAANQNHSDAQLNLGMNYLFGTCLPTNIDKALFYLTSAADHNSVDAQFRLGIIYYEGKYVVRNISKAIYYFKLAANNNFIESFFYLALIYYDEFDIQKAIYYYTLAANQNNKQARMDLGIIYFEGKYVVRDYNKAIYYLTPLAKENNTKALFILGKIYGDTKYYNHDINKSIQYYKLASDLNYANAQATLGAIYYVGKHVKRDINKSIYYLQKAANQNYKNAQFNLGVIYDQGKYIARDANKAIYYFSLVANDNYPDAQLNLGLFYYDGDHCRKDIKKGINYIMLSSVNGSIQGNFAYGYLLHEGKSVKQDIEGAIHCYKEASSFNNQYAKNNLGIIYKHGYGNKVKKNLGNAIEYFSEAIRQKNDILSMYNLAHLYFYEDGFKDKINKSIELLIKASKNLSHSQILLCLVLVRQHGLDIDSIIKTVKQYTSKTSNLPLQMCQAICEFELFKKSVFDDIYEKYKKIDFMYTINLNAMTSCSVEENNENQPIYPNAKNISKLFYEGFQDL